MRGLLVYLAGPGRANEHTDPHLVAGDPHLMAWHDDNTLDRASALSVARHLDRPRVAFGVEVAGGHVWHCSLSLRAHEGQLADDEWRGLCEDFIRQMGFDDQEGSRAPCRWVAVRHGLSKNGNDHVHLVVNLVREDGTKASHYRDYVRSQQAARALERAHGLETLESAAAGRASRGYDPAEREAVARRRARGRFEQARREGSESRTWGELGKDVRAALIARELVADQPRFQLARQVRACATAAADEAEFVRRMRRHGLIVRARFADGRSDVVTGFSVAQRPVAGERPIWYGGGILARDLTLPRLRDEWPDTPQAATAAVHEWVAARRGRRPVAPGREMREPAPELWASVTRDLEKLREELRAVPIDDRFVWAQVARRTSGAFAAWSYRVEATPGPLAATSDALARSAELIHRPVRPRRVPRVSAAAGAALLVAASVEGGPGVTAQLAMLRQLANLSKALHDMHTAAGEAQQAARIEAAVRGELATVGARLESTLRENQARKAAAQSPEAAAAVARASAGMSPATQAAGSPIPTDLTRAAKDPNTGRPGMPLGLSHSDDTRGR